MAIVLITHRLASIVDAEEILVFDNGRIVERGTHEELQSTRGRHVHLWHQQKKYIQDATVNYEKEEVKESQC